MRTDFDPIQFLKKFFKKKYQVALEVTNATEAHIYIFNKPGRRQFTVYLNLSLFEVYNRFLLKNALEQIKPNLELQ
jgi:hypothetical protein